MAEATQTTVPNVFPFAAAYRLQVTSDAYVYFEDSRPGEATPIIAICLPGIGDTRRQFRLLAPLLHERLGFRVLLGDLRGFGDSTAFEDAPGAEFSAYSPEAVASDVSVLMTALHEAHPSSRFILIGNSLSAGSMVLAVTSNPVFPIRSVVLLGPILRDSVQDRWFRPLSHLLFRSLYGAGLWMSYYATLFPGKKPADFEQEVALLRSHLDAHKGNIVNVGKLARATKNGVADAVSQLGQMDALASVAVLAFYGRKDPDFADFDAELAWIKEKISRIQIYEDPDGGHYPHLENPDKIVDAIAASLS